MGKHRIKNTFLKLAEKRTTFNLIFFFLVLVLGKISPVTFLTGIPFIFAGIFIRVIAAGTIKKNVSLTTAGPYQICRHPLYLGSFLLSLGLLIISQNFFVFLFFIIFFPLTYIPAMLKEEKFLTEKFGDEYINYKKSTSCFIPSLKKINRYEFSWEQLRENREYINWIIILLLIAGLLIKSYYIL
ncbi:MAG TPA: isoprenylcysteine carboxylmethyltransferase family protein [bacterium]|mgnify:CR=1 FL=1|nr:isoprenylcysteine carboxylmethyltransferase family protein [bacterium]HPP30577.1 isoprenylcysteine carboxylmethyltransferase family protein [bacterium]